MGSTGVDHLGQTAHSRGICPQNGKPAQAGDKTCPQIYDPPPLPFPDSCRANRGSIKKKSNRARYLPNPQARSRTKYLALVLGNHFYLVAQQPRLTRKRRHKQTNDANKNKSKRSYPRKSAFSFPFSYTPSPPPFSSGETLSSFHVPQVFPHPGVHFREDAIFGLACRVREQRVFLHPA